MFRGFKSHGFKSRILASLAGLALAGLASVAQADGAAGTQGGFGIHLGSGDRYSRFELQYETPSIWTQSFGGSLGRLDITPEVGLAYWHAHDGEPGPGSVWQLNLIPMFRWWLGSSQRFYVEAGVGPTVFNHVRFADKNYSTAFQFGDHIGMGYLLDKHSRIGLRYSHFSNADIKEPNPGFEVIQATYTYEF